MLVRNPLIASTRSPSHSRVRSSPSASDGGNGDPNAFDESAIFSPLRITVAPIVALIGYLFVVYAILKKDKGNGAGQ